MLILLQCLMAFMDVLALLMLARAIASWFPLDPDGFFVRFLYVTTEPAIMPVRALFRKFGWFQDLPIDMSFFFSYMIIAILSTLAEAVTVV